MTLNSSEVKNFLSWRIGTVLKSFLVASASCHLALAYIIRLMSSVLKFIPKIIFFIFQNWIEVILRAEEECLVFLPLGTLDRIELLVQYQSNVLSWINPVLEDTQVVEDLLDQVCDQLVQSMRNSDSRVRIVFVYRFNADFHSIFTLQVTGCDFPHGSNFGVPANPTFSGQLIFHLLVKKTLDMSLALQSVRTRQCAVSRSIVRLQQFSEILQKYTF